MSCPNFVPSLLANESSQSYASQTGRHLIWRLAISCFQKKPDNMDDVVFVSENQSKASEQRASDSRLKKREDDCKIIKVKNRQKRPQQTTSDIEIISTKVYPRITERFGGSRSSDLIIGVSNSRSLISAGTADIIANVTQNPQPRKRMLPQPIISGDPGPKVEPAMLKCTICLELASPETQLISTVCGHIFCKGCFESSQRVARNCPNCRKKMSKKSFHKLFL